MTSKYFKINWEMSSNLCDFLRKPQLYQSNSKSKRTTQFWINIFFAYTFYWQSIWPECSLKTFHQKEVAIDKSSLAQQDHSRGGVLQNILSFFKSQFFICAIGRPQCPRIDLNKRFLPRPKTITAWNLTPHRSNIRIKILHIGNFFTK